MRSVAVIGAGLLGLTTAYWLRKHGFKVTLVEREDRPGEGTSFANGGMLTPSQAHPWNSPDTLRNLANWVGREDSPLVLRAGALHSLSTWGPRFLWQSRRANYLRNAAANVVLGQYSLARHRELVADTGLAYDAHAGGTMQLFRSPEALDYAATAIASLEPHGVVFRVLDRRQAEALEPAIASSPVTYAGAIYFPDDESGDANLFCREMAAYLAERGVEFVYGAEIKRLDVAGGQVGPIVGPSGRIIEASAYVVAAGVWAVPLLQTCGIRLPIRPVKGYSLTCEIDGMNGAPTIPVVDAFRKIGVTRLGTRLRLAGTAEIAGFDRTLNERRLHSILTGAMDLVPALRAVPPEKFQRWAGLRPVTPTGFPVIGRTRYANLFINAGHGPLGWTFAAGSGKIAADLIATGTHDLARNPNLANRIS